MRAGDEWVLGELHPGVNTLRYATWVACHPEADALRAAMGHDVGAGVVYPAETGQEGGVPTRQSNALTGAGDVRLVFAHDSFGHDPRRSLRVGECDLVGTVGGLRVRSRDGRFDADLMDVLGDVVGAGLSQLFRALPPAAHQPRVTIDSLWSAARRGRSPPPTSPSPTPATRRCGSGRYGPGPPPTTCHVTCSCAARVNASRCTPT